MTASSPGEHDFHIPKRIKNAKYYPWTGEMVQWLKVTVPSSVANTHIVAHNVCNSRSGDLTLSSGLGGHLAHTGYVGIINTHTYKIF